MLLLTHQLPHTRAHSGNIMSTIADQVNYFLGAHGPTVTLEVACGSSIVALALAANALQAGDCDYALVLGYVVVGCRVMLLSPERTGSSVGRYAISCTHLNPSTHQFLTGSTTSIRKIFTSRSRCASPLSFVLI